jgi:nucleoside 2-deoxyribosyltransferase
MTKTIYLGGPDIFYPDATAIGVMKKNICKKYDFEGYYPIDNELITNISLKELAYSISFINEELMKKCDMMVANLTPFRGPSADAGTIYELGFMRGLGKEVHGYTTTSETYFNRIKAFDHKTNNTHDSNNYLVENFGLNDNLMIDGGINRYGGLFLKKDAPNLVVFEELIKTLAEQ